jgi:hypothetical protein
VSGVNVIEKSACKMNTALTKVRKLAIYICVYMCVCVCVCVWNLIVYKRNMYTAGGFFSRVVFLSLLRMWSAEVNLK